MRNRRHEGSTRNRLQEKRVAWETSSMINRGCMILLPVSAASSFSCKLLLPDKQEAWDAGGQGNRKHKKQVTREIGSMWNKLLENRLPEKQVAREKGSMRNKKHENQVARQSRHRAQRLDITDRAASVDRKLCDNRRFIWVVKRIHSSSDNHAIVHETLEACIFQFKQTFAPKRPLIFWAFCIYGGAPESIMWNEKTKENKLITKAITHQRCHTTRNK